MKDLPREVLLKAKQMGFSDKQVAQAVARSVCYSPPGRKQARVADQCFSLQFGELLDILVFSVGSSWTFQCSAWGALGHFNIFVFSLESSWTF